VEEENIQKKNFDFTFDLKEAWEEVKEDFSYGRKRDKAASAAKLFGKALSNFGVHLVKNAPAYAEKAKATVEASQENRRILREKYQSKSNAELVAIVKDDGLLGASEDERQSALAVLRERKEAASTSS